MAWMPLQFRTKEVFYDGKVNILYQDGTLARFEYFSLRCACVCASCVDEVSGEKILDDSKVAKDIHPLDSAYVGNYGLRIHWSDGHDTGIYNFRWLRESFPHESEKVN